MLPYALGTANLNLRPLLRMPSRRPLVNRIAPKAPNRVRSLRLDKAWPKAKLARAAGIALGTLDRIERGLSTREDRRRAVARALGVPYASVFPNEPADEG